MLPGVGVFGTGSTARVLVPLLRAEGFSIEALWGKTEEEAKRLAEEMNIEFYTSQTDDVLLHQDVDLVCINIPPPLTRQIAVKALGCSLNTFLVGPNSGGMHILPRMFFLGPEFWTNTCYMMGSEMASMPVRISTLM
ncbi:unnamed protein product [Caretta caretta]